jgi:hypothetical protein
MSTEDGSTTPKGEKMPDNVEAWSRLYGLAEQVMLEDKEEISRLKHKNEQLRSKLKGWVSVEDRLPEKDGYYKTKSAYYDDGEVMEFVKESFGHKDVWYSDESSQTSSVTHWAPYPPKGE